MKKYLFMPLLALLMLGMTGCVDQADCQDDVYDLHLDPNASCIFRSPYEDVVDYCWYKITWSAERWDDYWADGHRGEYGMPYFCTNLNECWMDKYERWGHYAFCVYDYYANSWDCPPGFWHDADYILDDTCSDPNTCLSKVHACAGEFCHDDFKDSRDCKWYRKCNGIDCEWESHCTEAYRCNNGICYYDYELVDKSEIVACTQNTDCPMADQVCVNDICYLLTCNTDRDCPESHLCASNICYFINEPDNPKYNIVKDN